MNRHMFKKLFTYIIIGFLQLSIGFTKAYAEGLVGELTPKNVFKQSESKEKAIEEEIAEVVKKEVKQDNLVDIEKSEEGKLKEEQGGSIKIEEKLQKKVEPIKKSEKVKEKDQNSNNKIITKQNINSDKIEDKKQVEKVKQKPSILKYYSGQNTLMYKEDNFIKMIQILTSLESGISFDQDDGKKIVNGDALDEILDDTIISVYLNSILYISEDLWSVWANGEKIISYNDKNKEIRVLSISPDEVKFLWTISKIKWDIINANNTIKKEVYTINDERVNMIFTLKPNQSFVPSLNKIIEGSIEKEGSSKNNSIKNNKVDVGTGVVKDLKDNDLDLFL